jgi:bacteriorhodopsin
MISGSQQEILKSAYISLAVQIIIGIIGIHGIFIPLKEEDKILTNIIILETIVQFIELCFYIWITMQLSKLTYEVTYTRYFDWFISTPIMLLTTVFFMEYLTYENLGQTIKIKEIIEKDYVEIIKIVIANFFMLLFGFLGERKYITRVNGFILGTIAFLYSFYVIYNEFVGENIINNILFFTMFIIWSLYGVAYLFPYVTKNTMYNILDIFSKNFYALFIYYVILQKSNYFS